VTDFEYVLAVDLSDGDLLRFVLRLAQLVLFTRELFGEGFETVVLRLLPVRDEPVDGWFGSAVTTPLREETVIAYSIAQARTQQVLEELGRLGCLRE